MSNVEPLSPATPNLRTNVSRPERWVSIVAGSAIAAYGLARRSISGLTLAGLGGALVWRGASGHCAVYHALGISTNGDVAEDERQVSVPYGRGIRVEKSVTVNATPEQLYAFWRNFENLPRIMRHLESVSCSGGGRSHWVAKGPLGLRVEWDAAIISERDDELIGWRSLPGSEVDTAGSVHFTPAPGNRGTKVRVTLKYDPPAGRVGAMIAKLFGRSPEQEIREDLHRFKQWMETGAVVAGQLRARC